MAKIIVESAVELAASHKEELEKKFFQAFGSQFQIIYRVDPQLIAGLRITTPSKVIDYSFKARLNQLSQSLHSNSH